MSITRQGLRTKHTQATARSAAWYQSLEAIRALQSHQASTRRSVHCSASKADAAAAAAPSSNGALSKIIDIELRSEAEQSYLAVRSIAFCIMPCCKYAVHLSRDL